jgi:hypothetical protein
MLLGFAWVLLLAGTQEPAPPAAVQPPPLPQALVAYYRDYNFLNAFSTRPERRELAAGWSERELTEPRLRALRDCMRRLTLRTLAVDSGFVRTTTKTSPFAERADLLEIRTHRVDASLGTATVELDVITLVPQANFHLIGRFEQLGREDEPMTAERLLSGLSQPTVMSREIHEWVLMDGAWMRETPVKTFVAR